MEWNNFAPVDPIRSLNSGIGSLYQCLNQEATGNNSCSRWQLESQTPAESIINFKNQCQTGLGGQFRECCPENLKSSFNQKKVWVKSNPDGFFTSCLHDLNQGSQSQVKTLMSDPRYDYKDLTVSYAERVRRYQALLLKLRDVWVNSDLGRMCKASDSIPDCLDATCPQLGYRLAENDYEICLASGDLLTTRNRGFCHPVCKTQSPPQTETQAQLQANAQGLAQASAQAQALAQANAQTHTNLQEKKLVQQMEQQVNYLLAKDQSQSEQSALENPNLLYNPLVPPDRRSSATNYYDSLNLPLNPPGRGDYAGFSVIGYLQLVNHPDRRLALYGRRISPQSYEYYTVNHIDPLLRIPIYSPDGQALKTNQTITIPGYVRPFNVVLYGPDFQSYRPY